MHKINHSLWIKPILSVDNMGFIVYKMLITFSSLWIMWKSYFDVYFIKVDMCIKLWIKLMMSDLCIYPFREIKLRRYF